VNLYEGFPTENQEFESLSQFLDAYRDEATADVRVTMGKLLTDLLETEHQLRLAQLELMKSNVKRELAENDTAGVKTALKESREECRVRADVGIKDARKLDKYEAALDDIRNAVHSATGLANTIATIDVILKRAGL
jgi:hypothetical protein